MNNLSKKIFFLILISVLLSYIPPTITGFVYDTNGQPINNVLITSEVDQIYSDKNGAFILLYENKNSTIYKWINRELNVGLNKKDFEKSSLLKLAD